MPEIEGVRKVNEWVMKNGRTLIITDTTVPVGDVPNGTLFTNPSGTYSETSKQLMIKQTGSAAWSVLDPTNIFTKGSIVNSLIGSEAVWTANIKKGNVTRDRIDDATGYIIDNSLYVNTSNTVLIDRSSPITLDIFGDFILKDKTATGSKINRTLTVEGKIKANSDITSNTAIKSMVDVSAANDVTAGKNISAGESISAVKSISAGADVGGKTLTIANTGTVGSGLTVGKTVNGIDTGLVKAIGNIEATQNMTVGSSLSVSIDITGGNNLTIARTANIGGTLNVTQNAKVGTTLEVTGAITGKNTLKINETITAVKDIVSSNGGVSAYSDIITNNGNISSKTGSVGAYGDIVSSNGNIISNSGYISAGNGVTIRKGGLTVVADGANISGNVTVAGTLTADRVYDAVFGDLAEGYVPAEYSEPGDILEITEDFKVKKAGAISTRVIGVHSDCYAHCFLATESEIKSGKKVAVGLIGQAPIKIAGKARIGELVVSAGEGIGRAVSRSKYVPGTVVGKVLENKDYEGLGLVMCFIFPS